MASLTPRIDKLERNLIINGNMDFWQRGTTFGPSTGQPGILADRFRPNVGATGVNTYTVTQSTDVPTVAQSGFQSLFSLSWAFTGAVASNGELIRYAIEGQDYQHIHGKRFRLQFWVKSATTGTYSVGFTNGSSNRSMLLGYTISVANTWQKIILDVPAETVNTGWNFDNTTGLNIWFGVSGVGAQPSGTISNNWAAGSARVATTQVTQVTSGSFLLTQVMLIPQDFTQTTSTNVDVPFQRAGKTISEELQMCQRYYEKSYRFVDVPGTASSYIPDHAAVTDVSGNALVTIYFKVPKRADPTFTTWAGTNSGLWQRSVSGGAYGNAVMSSTPNDTLCRVYTTGGTPGAVVNFEGHWAADAEL